MNNMVKRLLILVPIFAISPVLALPIIYKLIKKQSVIAQTMLAFFMALCAIITPILPELDSSRHMMMYNEFVNYPLSLIYFIQGHKDYVLYILAGLFAVIGIPFEWLIGFFVFMSYMLAFAIYRSLIARRSDIANNSHLNLMCFGSFFLSVQFLFIATGLRSGTSCIMMAYAWVLLRDDKYIKCIILAALSVCTHFFSWCFVPVLLIYIFLRKHKNIVLSNKVVLFLIIVLIGLGTKILSFMMGLLSEESLQTVGAGDGTVEYYAGDAGGDLNYSELSIFGKLGFAIERLPLIYACYIILFKLKGWQTTYERTFAFCVILFVVVFLPFFVPMQRISWLVTPILLYLIFENMQVRETRMCIKGVFFTCILSNVMLIYSYAVVFWGTPFYYLLMPINYVLSYRCTL